MICVLLLFACRHTATVRHGRDFNAAFADSIEKGKTPASELVRWWGDPQTKTKASGKDFWTWSYLRSTASTRTYSRTTTSEVDQKRLTATIENGIVVDYSYTESTGGGPVHTTIR